MKRQPRILIVTPNWLGDLIFVTPAFAAVKNRYPKCFLGVVTSKKCKPVLKNNPYIDKVYSLDEKGQEKNFFAKINFIKKIRSDKFNLAILLHRSLTKTVLFFLAGIKERIGYSYKKRKIFLTKPIPCVDKNAMHKQDYYLNILEKSGFKLNNKNCSFYTSEKEKKEASDLIKNKNPKRCKYLIGISPFTNWSPKNWPLKNYKKLIEIVTKKNDNILFFVTGKEKSSKVEATLSTFGDKIINLCGKTTLRKLASLYEKLDLVISGDSGPLHLAAAVKTNYIALFGPTDPNCTKPKTDTPGYVLFKNKECSVPCFKKICHKDNQCLNKLTPQKVAQLTLDILNTKTSFDKY